MGISLLATLLAGKVGGGLGRVVREGAILATLVALALALAPPPLSPALEVDAVAHVRRVIYGDALDALPVGEVRLADVNTPEAGELSYSEARELFLYLLASGVPKARDELRVGYGSLKDDGALSSRCCALASSYDSLSVARLLKARADELETNNTLMYTFLATTIALTAAAIYFARRMQRAAHHR